MARAVSVRVLDAPFHIDHPFDYALPDYLTDLTRGTIVSVPFGRGDRPVFGVVMGEATPDRDVVLKPVLSALDPAYALDGEMLGLSLFLSDYYLCSLGDAVRCVLPPAVFASLGQNIYRVPYCTPALTGEALHTLLGGKTLRSDAHKRILSYLAEHGTVPRSDLCRDLAVTPAQVSALAAKGYLTLEERETLRNPYADLARERDRREIHLSRAQMRAFETLAELQDTGEAKAALLHGVTGSGKTQIMLKLIDRTLAAGRTAIVMVPEIALTPQTVRIFCARYGERVAVIHSSLSAGERFDAWRRIRRGEVDLVIGTRSAVFAPLKNIGLIVVDEEHEHTYKSEQDPKYRTHRVCAYRAGVHHALVVLASATPSFESYYAATHGRYTLVPLTERFGGAKLPEAEIVDMRQELRAGNVSPLSHTLYDALAEVKERGEQAILFLNRRGYHASLQCRNCGAVLNCPHCSVALTLHTHPTPHLLCHLCGYRAAPPRACPECHDGRLSYVGYGTEKVESEVEGHEGHLTVLRMDADTATGKQVYDRMLDSFRRGEKDVLLGTQMVTKGHDFPRVTLVGVILADTGLYANDFRASERTFSLLTQVIGRAGRANAPGRAVIQTFSPANDVIRLAKAQDYVAFYESEIKLREQLCFPPFCDLVSLTLTSRDEGRLQEAIGRCADLAKSLAGEKYADTPLTLFGPLEAQVYRAAEQYRMRLVLKCRWNARSRAFVRELLLFASGLRGVSAAVDVNPLHA